MCAAENAVRRLFTLEEANQRIPLVRVIVQDIVDLFRDVRDRRERLAGVKRLRGERAVPDRRYTEELDQIEEDIRRDEEKLVAYVEELADLGVELKDPGVGLVDFPATLDDRVVYLCWKLGEPGILCWHELEAGFSGRQPVGDGQQFRESSLDDSLPSSDPDQTGS